VRATQFRQWATNVLREFALKGYVLDRKRLENGSFLGRILIAYTPMTIQQSATRIGPTTGACNFEGRPADDIRSDLY
jgi:hypothetical protein